MTQWKNAQDCGPKEWRCPFCNKEVAGRLGWYREYRIMGGSTVHDNIRICPKCDKPVIFLHRAGTHPAPSFGNPIPNLSELINSAYEEARSCIGCSAYTACVLVCRKLLMLIAVDKGAKENLRFVQYVDYLSDNHHVPAGSGDWVKHIKDTGNEATHELPNTSKADAIQIFEFTSMLLTLNYDYPARMKPKADA